MKLLEMHNIIKSFDGTPVLRDISLDVEQGEVVAIIGPSGSGKSTLLRCATLLETVDSGFISYLGKAMVQTDENGKARYAPKKELHDLHRHFGLVFQSFNLFPHYTVLDNIILPMRKVQKIGKAGAAQTARELLDKVGLAEKECAYPGQLSGGQQQRVSIARALALKPDILFFDEPTSALDPELTGEILRVIQQLAAENMTMIIVTHEMAFARMAANRIVFMDGGMVIESGTAQALMENPQSERTRTFLSDWTKSDVLG